MIDKYELLRKWIRAEIAYAISASALTAMPFPSILRKEADKIFEEVKEALEI